MSAAAPAIVETDAVTGDPTIAVLLPARHSTVRALTRAATGSFGLNLVNTGAAVLTTVILARVMDLAAFGIYSWVVATIWLLTVPAVLGVDRLLVRDIAVYIGNASYGLVRGLLVRSAQLVLGMCLAIFGAIALAVWLSGGALGATTVAALAVGLVALPFLAYARVGQAALMGIHQVVLGQVPDLLLRPVSQLAFVLVIALIGSRLDAPSAVALFTASAAASLVLAAALLRSRMGAVLQPSRPTYQTRRWVAAAFALVLLSGGLVINSQTGVVLLGLIDTPESAGLYSVAQRGALLVAFPLMAASSALAPIAARLWSAKDVGQLQRLVTFSARAVLLGSLPIALVFIVAGESLLGFVFGASFTAAATALSVLSLGQVANSSSGAVATLLIMTGNTWRAGMGIAAGIVVNIVLAVALIPTYHTVGAAIAAAASLVVSNLIHVVMARRSLGIDPTALGLPPRPRP